MREKSKAYSVLVGRPEGKSPLGSCRHEWENNIEMARRQFGRVCTGFGWLRKETSVRLL
jgi:hypothetical protein